MQRDPLSGAQKRPLSLMIGLLAVFALIGAACGIDSQSATETTESPAIAFSAPEAQTFRIAVVAPSASDDLAYTQSMVDAVNKIGETRDIELAITDRTFIVDEAAAAIRGYAEDGFDLVIAHGSQYGQSVSEIAPDFPETSFAWGTAADNFGLPNVWAYSIRSDEGGYVMGTIAAQLSTTGVIGVVGPVEVGDAKLYVDGFVNGAKAQDSSVEVNVTYIDSFSDVALAAEAAQAHIENGADVLTGSAQMVVGATDVAAAEGIPWFGTQANQTPLGPDFVVASQVYHWEVILADIIGAIETGILGGEAFALRIDNGGLVIEYNDGYSLSNTVRSEADATAAGIADAVILTGVE